MGWSDLKITILVTTAKTFLPNKILFTGSRGMCLFWGRWRAPVNPRHLGWVTFLSELQGFYLYNGANTNPHLKGQLWGLTKPKECMVQLQCLGNPQSEWLPFLADWFFSIRAGFFCQSLPDISPFLCTYVFVIISPSFFVSYLFRFGQVTYALWGLVSSSVKWDNNFLLFKKRLWWLREWVLKKCSEFCLVCSRCFTCELLSR